MPKLTKEKITLMGWNIENFGVSKYNAGGSELLDVVKKVITKNEVHLAAFSEIRSRLGATIGSDLERKLGPSWKAHASPPYGNGRWEQYLFVWDTAKVVQNTSVAKAFEDTFQDSTGGVLGYPRGIAKDRPPYLGHFTTKVKKKHLLFAIMHSPAPTPEQFPRQAGQQLAQVQPFRDIGDACVLMGDFNVKNDINAYEQNTKGQLAFQDLVKKWNNTQNTELKQLLIVLQDPKGVLTSLKPRNQAFIGMTVEDGMSEPYDQIFFRAGTATYRKEGVEELLGEGTLPKGYLAAVLRALATAASGTDPGKLDTPQKSFTNFRYYVSDHLPVIVDVKF